MKKFCPSQWVTSISTRQHAAIVRGRLWARLCCLGATIFILTSRVVINQAEAGKPCAGSESPFEAMRAKFPDCGLSFVELPTVNRFAGGREAKVGQFPSYAHISVKLRTGTEIRCGGVIIGRWHILSAAHCTYPVDEVVQIDAYPGLHNWTGASMEHRVRAFCKSDRFSLYDDRGESDVSVLRLEEPIEFDKYIQPACMPNGAVPVGQKAYGVGIGAFGNLPTQRNTEHLSWLPFARLSACPSEIQARTAVCYKSRISGAVCSGDSGGPLIAKLNGRHTVLGIVSKGEECSASEPSFGVFTDVLANRGEIQKLIACANKKAKGKRLGEPEYDV